ncbi:MAG TPA: cobyrinate a,c-diamide synthase [Alphaproteobacteria bacterium]
MSAAGLIVAAPASGSGKTTITMALLRALARRGLRVAAAKAGPDYIDPGFHAAAAGRPCFNLDPWAMRPATIATLIASLDDADLILCEGAMGLFDGIDARGTGSCADLAAATGWPVVLVVDAGGQAASVGALVAGFAAHRPDVDVAGIIFNRVGGARHAELLAEAVRLAAPQVRRLGALPRDARLALPDRHLGLVQAREHADLARRLDQAADRVSQSIDLDALVALARPARRASPNVSTSASPPVPPLGQRIAVAHDDAFAFAYSWLLESWRAAGAELSMFSPLRDEAPPAGADAIYLPGGYPELHAARLAANRRFLDGLRAAARRGVTIYGECGGYMVLGRTLTDAEGRTHALAGLLALDTSFATRRLTLGYRRARLSAPSPLGPAGTCYRGHEFHYSTVTDEARGPALFEVTDAGGRPMGTVGQRAGNVMGSFIHLVDREPVW